MTNVSLIQDPATSTLRYHDATNYEDLRFPLQGQRLDISSGRIDYNYDENTVDFGTNARYPNEPICFVAQMPHSKSIGSKLFPHLHWTQEENNIPNWIIEYRWYNNGELVPGSYSQSIIDSVVFPYTAGALAQMSALPDMQMHTIEKISSILDIKLFRDSANTSGLFAGADPYSIAAKAKEFDLHYQLDSVGSGEEYEK